MDLFLLENLTKVIEFFFDLLTEMFQAQILLKTINHELDNNTISFFV